MPTYHRDISAAERHPVPRYGFSSLGAAQAHVYTVADESCFVRVGSSAPYTHYLITEVSAGVATLVEVGGALSFGAPSALVVGGSNVTGVSFNVPHADHVHELPPFGTSAGEIAEGDHTHTGLGSSYLDVWNTYLPPVAPNSRDDMMDNGVAIDAKWTIHDPSSCIDVISATAYPRRYLISKTNAQNGIGLRQTMTGMESFSMCVRVSALEPCYAAGLAVGFGTGATDDYRIVGNGGTATVPAVRSALVAGTRSIDGTSLAVDRPMGNWPWFRMRGNVSPGACSVAAECSADGEHWVQLHDFTGVSDIAWFGIMIHGPNTSHSSALFSNFQMITAAGGAGAAAWDALIPGRMSRLAIP